MSQKLDNITARRPCQASACRIVEDCCLVRVTSQFVAVLAALIVLQGMAGAFVVSKVNSASAIRDESLVNAAEIVLSAERLENKANQEVAHLLGYLRGASTRAQIEELREAFRAESDHALSLVDPGTPLQERFLRIQEVEESLFESRWGAQQETLFTLIDVGRERRETLLDRNAEHRVTVTSLIDAFGSPEMNTTLFTIRTDVERERAAIHEFEAGVGAHMSESAMRTLMYGINRDIVFTAREEIASRIEGMMQDLEHARAEDPSSAEEITRLLDDLDRLQERVSFTRPSSKQDETLQLFDELHENITRAEAFGVDAVRGNVVNVGEDVPMLVALGHLMASQQALRVDADDYFANTLLIQHVVRGTLGVRAANLQDATAEAVGLANEEAATARALADRELARARAAIVATVGVVIAPVVFLGWLVVQRLQERIRSFDAAAQAVSQGQFDVPPPPPKRDDFDTLSTAWSHMTAALAAREKELAHKNETLRQNERMATLGSLVAGVAHEVNNPLAFIKTTEEMTLMDAEEALEMPEVRENAELRSLLENVRDGATTNIDGIQRIEKINQMLKGFAGPSRSDSERMNLNDVIDGVLIIAHNRLKSRYRVEKCFTEVPDVVGSPQEVGQIILNLIINAADACTEEGRIEVATRVEGDRVIATVRDDGPGVDPAIRERLFTPFATSKSNGSGLGLHISRSIAEAHGGSLRLDDTDEGASFTLEIPVAAQDDTGTSARTPTTSHSKENEVIP